MNWYSENHKRHGEKMRKAKEQARKEGIISVAQFFKDRLKADISHFTNGSITFGELDRLLRGEIPEALQKEG